jgi:Ca2+-binding EF-hand superfamily protein
MKFSHPFIISAACALIAITAISAPAKASEHHGRKMMQAAMVAQDQDKDGSLSLVEFLAAKEGRFTLIDTNKDGFITAQEMAAAPPATDAMAKRMKEWQTKATAADKALMEAHQASRFRGLDANSDGKISHEEYLALDTLKFAAMDENGDGKVDVRNPRAVGNMDDDQPRHDRDTGRDDDKGPRNPNDKK